MKCYLIRDFLSYYKRCQNNLCERGVGFLLNMVVEEKKVRVDVSSDYLLSDDSFLKKVIFNIKWPGGFTCNRCHENKYYYIVERNVYECRKCHYQESLTANTFLHKSKIPLLKWFQIIKYLEMNGKLPSISKVVELSELSYPSAWLMLNKIKNNMPKTFQIMDTIRKTSYI